MDYFWCRGKRHKKKFGHYAMSLESPMLKTDLLAQHFLPQISLDVEGRILYLDVENNKLPIEQN